MRFKTTVAVTVAAVVAGLTAAAAPAGAGTASAPVKAAPGQVCFWTGAGMHGQAWCYAPPGYAEAENGTQRNAHSFESKVNGSVYAISYGPGAGCVYREIRKDDYDEDWSWATKIDGVSDSTLGCEQG